MSNHLHLLIEVGDTALSRIMQNLQFRYTQKFNARYRKTGHLFQGRYKAIVCDRDAYLLKLTCYIHLNPVRARMAPSAGQYQWSSYRAYTGEADSRLLDPQARDLVLGQLSRNWLQAVREYQRLVDKQPAGGHTPDWYRVIDQRFLGDKPFIAEVRKNLPSEQPKICTVPLTLIADAVAAQLGIETQTLHSMTRSRCGTRGRAVAGYLARSMCGYTNREIAGYFKRDQATLSEGISSVEKRINKDAAFAETVTRIHQALQQQNQITEA